LLYKSRNQDLDLPVLSNILRSNDLQVKRAIDMIIAKNHKKVSILGFSFKAATDDLRESPMVVLIEYLIGKGYNLRLYDRNVNLAKIMGANRDYILNRIPHIARIMVGSIEEVLSHGNVIVIGNNDPEFKIALGKLKPGQIVIDLVRITDNEFGADQYDGICW
jgi:GDP-mannose 6-dehydrogenase